MGSLQASEMASIGGVNAITMGWHLQSNHFPPHPSTMIPVALAAVEHANNDEWDALVDLPEGVEHRVFGTQVPVHEIVSALHLDGFLDQGGDDDFDDEDDSDLEGLGDDPGAEVTVEP